MRAKFRETRKDSQALHLSSMEIFSQDLKIKQRPGQPKQTLHCHTHRGWMQQWDPQSPGLEGEKHVN